jgi:hypothetical protein
VKPQGVFQNHLLVGFHGANIKEFLVTILREAKPPQIQCLSPEDEFWNELAPNRRSFAVKRTLERSEILFRERKGSWTTDHETLKR